MLFKALNIPKMRRCELRFAPFKIGALNLMGLQTLLLLLMVMGARGESFPSKPVSLIVPFTSLEYECG